MELSREADVRSVRLATWGDLIRWSLAVLAALLALGCNAGCMVEAMYAVPIGLERAASSISRALPVDETRYLVRSPRVDPAEPALADARSAQTARPQSPAAPSKPLPQPIESSASSSVACSDLTSPMPVLSDRAIVRRTRM